MDIDRQINTDMEREITQSLEVVSLTDDEVAMFEKIRSMEAVHNELGYKLGAYKDHIVETRNMFVAGLTRKYNIEKPSLMTYDPFRQKLVSVFHPDLKAHRIVNRPHAFTQLASEVIMDAIKKLGEYWKATGGR